MILDYYNRVIFLKRNKTTKDAAGGNVRKPTNLGSFLAREENLSGNQNTYQQRNTTNTFDKIFTTEDCPVQEGDVIDLHLRTNNEFIRTYTVRRVEPMETVQLLHHIEMDCEVYE